MKFSKIQSSNTTYEIRTEVSPPKKMKTNGIHSVSTNFVNPLLKLVSCKRILICFSNAQNNIFWLFLDWAEQGKQTSKIVEHELKEISKNFRLSKSPNIWILIGCVQEYSNIFIYFFNDLH